MDIDARNVDDTNTYDRDLDDVKRASRRFALGNRASAMSTHEHSAAAIVNGRIDLLDEDYRMAIVRMGRGYAHAVIDVIFDSYDREMTLPADHPDAPVGSECLLPQYRNDGSS